MRPSDRQRGGVSVEFATVLPLVAVVMLLVAQIGLIVAQYLAVQHAAREGARVAAITNDDDRARDAALTAGNLDPATTDVTVEPPSRLVGHDVTVTVSTQPAIFPVVGRFVPEHTITARVTMRTEGEP